jgi:tartrate/fumarate subfamily iron-sulfur-dependent hydro-lyase beta chain
MSTTPLASVRMGGAFRRLAVEPRFRRLWFAQMVSGIGDWLVIGLLIPLVTALSGGSSFAVAGILIAKIIPALLFSSVIGALVDRFDRRKVMIAADIVRSTLVLTLLFTNSLAAIYLVVLLMETASLFFWPARNALIPQLVAEQDVVAANGAMYTTQQAAMLVGLTASGAIMAGFEAVMRYVLSADLVVVDRFVGLLSPALLGPRAGFFLDTLTFLLSALIVTSIGVSARADRLGGAFDLKLFGKDVADSFHFLRGHRELSGLLVTVFLAILGGGAIIPVGIDYVNSLVNGELFAEQIAWLQRLSGSPQTFMLVFMAAGMVTGAVMVHRLEQRLKLQTLFVGSVAAFGLSMLGFASVRSVIFAGIFAGFAGACIATLTVAGNSYVIRTTENAIRGRVFTAMESVIRVALLLSMVIMAPLNDTLGRLVINFVRVNDLAPDSGVLTGPRITLMLSSAIVLGAAFYGYRALRWRECADADATTACQDTDPHSEEDWRTMPGPIRIDLPADAETLAGLVAGDEVALSGPVYTARDATHARILAELERDGRLPYGLAGQTLFYAGPTPARAGRPVGAVGPTTASRMDTHTPALMRAGIVATIGKGARSPEVLAACREAGGVYFAAVGGAAALLATHVESVEPVAYPELGTEALTRMVLRDLPAFVATDARGGDLYADAPAQWRAERGDPR